MTSQELMTLVADRIPVKIAILDNHKLGMIRQWQELFYAGNYHSSHLPGPDYVMLAQAYGVPAFKVTTTDGVDDGHPQGAGRGRPGADLVRDGRGAERLPHHARGQGPVRPDRRSTRGMSAETPATPAARPPARPPPRPRPPAHIAPARAVPGTGAPQRHILVVLVMDRPGVLNRVASLMRARNFNIDSLAVSRTDKENISRMTLTLHRGRGRGGAGREAAVPPGGRAQGPGRHRGPARGA